MQANGSAGPEFCTGAHAEREFGLSRNAIYRAVMTGLVRATIRPGSAPLYSLADLQAFSSQRTNVVRPGHRTAS
jgi:hypothetical protein